MLKLAVFLAALATLSVSVNAKVFSLCELIRELRRQGYPEYQLRNWACLLQHKRGMNTSFVSHRYADSSTDSLRCYNGEKQEKRCNITCAHVLTDDITVAAKCAKQVFNRQGFRAWYIGREHCRTAGISHC